MSTFYRTFPIDGGDRTHIEGIGDSYTLCGQDTAGDTSIYRKEPEKLTGQNHRITCEQCQQVIQIVKDHLKKGPKP